jgi:MscS family membrane protein
MNLIILNGDFGWAEEAIATILIVIVFNFIAKWVLKNLHFKYLKRGSIWLESFATALYKPLSYFTWYFAIIQGVNLLTQRVLARPLFDHSHQYLEFGLVIALAWFLFRWKNHVVKALLIQAEEGKAAALEKIKADVLDKIGTVIIIVVAIFLLLEISGRSMNTLIAFGGISGLAIAFASQQIIANFFGGLMIYTTHPFSIGDWINLPEKNIEGNVEEIGWYMTLIRTFDKRPIYVPNSTFSSILVMTPSRMSHRKVEENIGIRYDDISAIKPIMADIRKMLAEHPLVDQTQHNLVYFKSFGNYSLDIHVSAYTKTIEKPEFVEIREDILLKCAVIIANHKAEMPFPTSVVIPGGQTAVS